MLILVHLKVEVDEDLGSFLLSILLYGFVLLELLRSADAASEWKSILRVIIACWRMSHSKRALGASLAFWRSSFHRFAYIRMACFTKPPVSLAEVYCNGAAVHAFPVNGAGTVLCAGV